jgi:hypothetical protein
MLKVASVKGGTLCCKNDTAQHAVESEDEEVASLRDSHGPWAREMFKELKHMHSDSSRRGFSRAIPATRAVGKEQADSC